MARYTENLNECTDPTTTDWLQISDTSAGSTDRDRKVSAGLIPWMNRANTFTAVQALNITTNNTLLTLDTGLAASTPIILLRENGADRCSIWTAAGGVRYFAISTAHDLGTNPGIGLLLAHNNNASTPGAGFVRFNNIVNSWRAVWVDAAGQLRINSALPTNANDTAGTVVGMQTSSLDAKRITGEAPDAEEAHQHIAEAAGAVRAFTYLDGAYNGEEFSGIVVDWAPRYGMDRDEDHPGGKSLNVITALGDLMIATADLAARVASLEARPPKRAPAPA